MTVVTTEAYEPCDNDASTPEMGEAEAKEHKEAPLTEFVEIAAPKSQFTEVTAVENTDKPENNPEYKAVNEGGVQAVNGGRDQGHDLQDDPPDDGDGHPVRERQPDDGGDKQRTVLKC